MKSINYFSVIIMLIASCNCQKKVIDSTNEKIIKSKDVKVQILNKDDVQLPSSIVVQSLTRGYFRKISIINGRIYVQTDQQAKPVFWELNKEDLNAVLLAYNEIDVTIIKDLKAPTDKRFYDGAPITHLSITKDSEVFTSSDFDGGSPPKHIEKLVNTITEVAEKLNKE